MTRSRMAVSASSVLAIAALFSGGGAAFAQQARPDRSWIKRVEKPRMPVDRDGVGNLPFARGRSFTTLDDYLAYLRAYAAPIDRPWYSEVRPGVFRLKTGNLRTEAPARTFTRAALERKFGFRR